MRHSRLDQVVSVPPPATFCDASDVSRIHHWIVTGYHVIDSDFNNERKRTHGIGSCTIPSFGEEDDDSHTSSCSSPASSDVGLFGRDNDLLIPSAAEISRTFHVSQHTWLQFVSRARAIPPNCMPRGTCDPSIMLKDVPALPKHKASGFGIQGVAVWQRWTGEDEAETMSHGLEKMCRVLATEPLACVLSLYGGTCPPDNTPRGLGILTLCWSYILSTRLLELQDRKATYSGNYLRPVLAAAYVANPTEYVLDLRTPASPGLVRWLCAILATGPGWRIGRGRLPTWTAHASGDIRFVILTDKPVSFDTGDLPPNSSRAAELLVELCGLFGLDGEERPGRGRTDGGDPQSELLPPYTAAFLAALALPLYRNHELEPRLVLVPLDRRIQSAGSTKASSSIRQYVADLPYYMTLSADRLGQQSILWSMFWQPDIQCNLASPWLGGILSVLQPLIDVGDVTTLANTFALRRPRVALWWLGVFLLGSPDVLKQMVLWLDTTEGQYGRGLATSSWPDITVSAWTGSPNSFWEQQGTVAGSYPNPTDLVPRADVLNSRFNLVLQSNHWNRSFCWRPFGYICKTDVELDIWPSLERGSTRKYSHWVWRIENPEVQLGFRRDTGRFVDIYDDLGLVEPQEDCHPRDVVVRKRPTIVAVGRMLSFFMMDVHGNIAEGNAALPGIEKHKWQKHWNILPSRW